MNNIDITSKKQINKMLKSLKEIEEDDPISFEYVMTALFPTVFFNIQEKMKEQYTKGYIQGLQEGGNNES